jgi:ankyrin repeat protein
MATIGTKAPLVKEIVTLLISAQVDVNETNKQGYTALMNAAKRNYADTIELLIEAGADIRLALSATEKGPAQIALDMTKDKICISILREAEAKRAAYERSLVSAEQGRQLMTTLRSGDRKVCN